MNYAGVFVRHRPRVCLAVVILLSVASFIVALGHMSQSVWFDESQTHLIASQSTLGGVAAVAKVIRPYPPLYFFATHYSLRLRDDETGLRLPAALFGALSVLAVFLLGRSLVDSLSGVITAFLFVLTPGVFRYFVDGNSYTLLTLASALSTVCLIRAVRSDEWRDWLRYALMALVGMGAHAIFVFHLGAQFSAGLYLRASERKSAGVSFRRLLTIMGALFAFALLTLIYIRSGGTARPPQLWRLPESRTLIAMAGMYAGALSLSGVTQIVIWGLLQLLGVYALFRRGENMFWFVVILVALPVITITLFAKSTLPYMAYRYSLGTFPLACVVAACSWNTLSRSKAFARYTVGVAFAVYCALGAVFIARADTHVFGYQDWRAAVEHLRSYAAPGELVLVLGKDNLVPLRYYYKAPAAAANSGDQLDDLVASRLDAADGSNQTAWVVLPTFASENAFIARYTQSWKQNLDEQERELAVALRKRFFSVCQTVRFQRITVLAVRRQPCPY